VNELFAAGGDLVVWAQAHAVVAVMAGAVLAAPAAGCVWLTRRMLAASRTHVHEVERRLAQLSSAVELLTDTTESGLQAAFIEIQQLTGAGIQKAAKQPGLQTRVRRAATKGRSAREIAVREGVSEGEVRLRLTLAGAPQAVPQAAAVR
jgi:hypothetical protein